MWIARKASPENVKDQFISLGHNQWHDFFYHIQQPAYRPGDTVACGMLPKPRYIQNIMGFEGLIDYRLVDVDNVAEVLALVGGRVDRLKHFRQSRSQSRANEKEIYLGDVVRNGAVIELGVAAGIENVVVDLLGGA